MGNICNRFERNYRNYKLNLFTKRYKSRDKYVFCYYILLQFGVYNRYKQMLFKGICYEYY